MVFLNAWIFFALVPLYFLFKKSKEHSKQTYLLYITLTLMIIAISRPALKDTISDQKFDAQDYIIALDASFSMQADDIKPTRYIKAKKVIKKLVKEHPKDRFTIFIFTSKTLLISPPTTDTAISLQALDAINPKYILTKSTNLLNLFEKISTLSLKQKNLIIFSDGGDEHDMSQLIDISQKHNIKPYIVATATLKGSALKKDGYYIKDIYSSLVISKINPSLKELAAKTNGKYYTINDINSVEKLIEDIDDKHTKQESIKVQNYTELYYYILLLAIFVFFISITKIHQFILPLTLLLLLVPIDSKASLFDFYYIYKAESMYKNKDYKNSAINFSKVTPSPSSYYNTATSFYKAGHYKTALNYYSQIESKDKKLKQKIFYNMGNCAVKLKRYDRAERFYIQALALGKDKDALHNLYQLYKLNLKTGVNITDMLPSKNAQSKKNSSKSISKQKDQKNSGSKKNNSMQGAQQNVNGKGSDQSKKEQSSKKSSTTNLKNNFQLGYKAYENINKGYTNEKEPW